MQTQTKEIRIHQRTPHAGQLKFLTSPAPRIIIRAGRRGGKTTGIAYFAVEEFLKGRRVLYATPTQDQIERFWYEVKLSLEEPIDYGVFVKNETRHTITLPKTEQRIRAKTAWNADTLRGDFADVLIFDEWQLMNEDAWNTVGAPMLLDTNGRAVFIYTPPSAESRSVTKATDPRHAAKLFKRAQQDSTGRWAAFHFSSHDNPYLSKEALAEIVRDMTPLAYRMEILGEDVEYVPGAVWTTQMLDETRVTELPFCHTVGVGVDPHASTGQTGIIVAGVAYDAETQQDHLYIFADYTSEKGALPAEWAAKVVAAYETNVADVLVGEVNNGGDMVEAVIREASHGININYTAVRASRGKFTRAQPVSALWNPAPQSNMVPRAHIVGHLPYLEEELCGWVPGRGESPNRLDAMVWIATALMVAPGGDFSDIQGLGHVENFESRWR